MYVDIYMTHQNGLGYFQCVFVYTSVKITTLFVLDIHKPSVKIHCNHAFNAVSVLRHVEYVLLCAK